MSAVLAVASEPVVGVRLDDELDDESDKEVVDGGVVEDLVLVGVPMLIPTAGVIALLGAGLVADIGTLLMIEHVVMLPSMLVAMLLRSVEYSRGGHGEAVAAA